MKKLLYNLRTINFANIAHPLRLIAFLLASTITSAQAKISLERTIEPRQIKQHRFKNRR